jgi:hypothetical protein
MDVGLPVSEIRRLLSHRCYGLVRLPWQQWDRGENPNWWRSYNDVKHERHGHFASANLENALDAVAGLLVLVSYPCEKELRARTALPWPQMLTLDPSLSSYIRKNARTGHILPDFRNRGSTDEDFANAPRTLN